MEEDNKEVDALDLSGSPETSWRNCPELDELGRDALVATVDKPGMALSPMVGICREEEESPLAGWG